MSELLLDARASVTDENADSIESWRSLIGPRLLVAALVAWLWSLIGVDLRAMTDVGLMSVMPSSFFIALALLTVGFLFVLEYRADRRGLVNAYLVVFAAIAHATPALLYGTVRYSWSYKHLGVVDFIQRTGSVDPDAEFLQIYHGWPGLFSATAMLSDLSGVSATTIAIWTPFVLSLVSLLALSIVFRTFVADPRTTSLALWMFVLANWVGQEYYSPQGFTYTLYLALLALVIPVDRVSGRGPARFEFNDGRDLGMGRPGGPLLDAVILLVIFSIVASHQLTPIMVVVTFAIFSLFRVARTAWISVAMLGAMLLWVVGPAFTYVRDNVGDATGSLGSPAESSTASVIDTAEVSIGQAIVVIADRFLAEAMVVLAVIGVAVAWRRHRQGGGLLLALLGAPIVLLFTDYGGEALFRSYLFAVPWIALASAYGIMAMTEGRSFTIRLAVRSLTVSLLLVAFLLAYLGKERSNYFTHEENDLAAWLYETAPPNTLLIEGSRNYPGSAKNYENFVYVPIAREPDSSLDRMNADPEGTLYRWLTDDRYAASYLIVTRSMKVDQESVPTMPAGLLDRIEAELRASDRFTIVQSNVDGLVFAVTESDT